MARRTAWLSVVVSALVGLFLIDRWTEPETSPRTEAHPVLTAPMAPPEEGGPMAAVAPIALPPPPAPRVEIANETSTPEPPPATEPERVVRPMKATPSPKRPVEAEPRDIPKIAIEPLRPSPEPSPPKTPETSPVDAMKVDGSDKKVASSGRVLLRLLEHGSGPTIEIAWPTRSRAREKLYDHFLRCHGMTVAVMDDGNRLFVAVGPPGQPWAVNLDRYSGFVRQPKGSVTRSEDARVRAIKNLHPGLRRGRPVHVFPRATDAVLLGGLRQLVGKAYVDTRTIQAIYRLGGQRLFIEDVRVEGEAVAGRIDLSGAARSNCA
jgi:hypothetical protein